MRRLLRALALSALLAVFCPAFAAAPAGPDDLLPGFEITVPDAADGLLEIVLPGEGMPDEALLRDLGLLSGDARPQLPDSLLTLDATDELLTQEMIGAGLAKIVVKRGIKTVKKLFKRAQAARAKRIALRNFPPKGCWGTMRVVSYNVGVFHKSGSDKTFMVADMLKEMKADVAGLQELDKGAARTGGVDQLHALSEALGGWNYRFAPAIPHDGGQYGIGIVSKRKYRILDSWTLSLDRGKGAEQRVLDVVEFPKFVLATTHLDHKSDAAQLAQAKAVNQALYARYGQTHKVVILCGDFNAKPTSRTVRELKKNWSIVSNQARTYDSSKPKQCIDYIMVMDNNSSYEIRYAAVPLKFDKGDVTQASDHLPVYVDIKPKRR